MKTLLIAGNSLETTHYNVTGNGERECLKSCSIGQSAGKGHKILEASFTKKKEFNYVL